MSYNTNNQLDFFFFPFSLVLKQNTFITFPNQNLKHPKTQSELQPSQNPQHPTSTSTILFSQQSMETSIANTQFIISMKLRKSFLSINIERT